MSTAPPPHQPRPPQPAQGHLFVALGLLVAALVGCSAADADADGAAEDCPVADVTGTAGDADDVSDAAGDASTSGDGASDGGALDGDDAEAYVAPALDACMVACDRAIACSVSQCSGYDWASSGALYADCAKTCAQSPLKIGAATTCKAAIAELEAHVLGFKGSCDKTLCDNACAKVADCIVAECELVDAAGRAKALKNCVADCTPGTSPWVHAQSSCAKMIDSIAKSSPAFAASCHHADGTCASAASCEPYAAKLSGCLEANCGAHIAPFKAGLVEAFTGYCSADAKCPGQAEVDAVNAASTTCAAKGIVGLGANAPFKKLCDDKLGVSTAAIAQACTDLMTCPGTGWLPSHDVCMVFFALRDDVATRVGCLNEAKTCIARGACLQGLK